MIGVPNYTSYNESDNPINEEEPFPSFEAVDSAQLEETTGHEAASRAGELLNAPEECKSCGKFRALVE